MNIHPLGKLLLFVSVTTSSHGWAAETVETVVDAKAGAASCIEVTVDGEKIPPYDCLTQKLMPKPGAKPSPDTPELASQGIINKPANALGLFNYATTSNRMGNTFGTSVYPQRPPATPAAPAFPR